MTAASLTAIAAEAGITKQVHQAFQSYQVARNHFINTLHGLLNTKDDDNIALQAMLKSDVLAVLCCPLTADPSSGVQSLALGCLAKLASSDPLVAQVVVSCGVLDSVVQSLSHESSPVQAASDRVLSAVAKSSTEYAERVMSAGALNPLLAQLKSASSPSEVKERAVKTLDSLIQSSTDHALVICNEELLSTLVALLLKADSPSSLVKSIVVAIGNASSLSTDLSSAAVNANVLDPLKKIIQGSLRPGPTPPDLKAAALQTLSHLASHNEALADRVAATGVIQPVVLCLTDKTTPAIRRNAASLILQLVQKTPSLANAVQNAGGPAMIKNYFFLEKGQVKGLLDGVSIVGSMASYSAVLAKSLVDAGAYGEVVNCIKSQDHVLGGMAAWAVEQATSHSHEDITMPLVERHRALQELIDVYSRTNNKALVEKKTKLKSAIKATIRNCSSAGSLENFVDPYGAPEISKHVLARLVPLLESSPKSRQQFVTCGALQRLQEAMASLCPSGEKFAQAINVLFPTEVVDYYRQGIK